ncbi:MAG: CheR family methyltransferase [Dongiaceae bacterium]
MGAGKAKAVPTAARAGAGKRRKAESRQDAGGTAVPPIVGMGASAGGLEAFEKFFLKMPPDSGIGFVLVSHMDAHHKSALTELIQRYTAMPVVAITDQMPVLPDRIHVIPPNATLTIAKGRLRVVSPRAEGMTIDAFFRALAGDQAENAIGIVLSGSGSDGTLGLKAIKEAGGLTLAQAGGSSRYDSMPRNAAATGLVDFVLPVEEMPARLVELVRDLRRKEDEAAADGFRRATRRALPEICELLRAHTGHDFSHYKESTFMRRLQRRMQVAHLAAVPAYVDLLRREPAEAEALFRDLLIGVTQFFRDPGAFEALDAQVIPKLFEGKTAEDQVRVWVPGCATGEEAYSIAMLLADYMAAHGLSLKVQIFGTDIDDHALAVARAGIYPESVAVDLPPDKLDRYLVRQESTYRVANVIREMCIFSVHNLIKDAPFSRLDLISCRNVMIYLDAALQNRLVPLFHFALRQRGFLFLGPAENVTQHTRLFQRLDGKQRLFKARPAEASRPQIDFPLTTPGHRAGSNERSGPPARIESTVAMRAQRIIEAYAPACVVVDGNSEVLHFSGRTGRFLQPSTGTASLNLFNIVDPALRPDLRSVLHQARTTSRKVVHGGIALPVNGSYVTLTITVEPLPEEPDGAPRLCVVLFQESAPAKAREPVTAEPGEATQKDETIAHLESELISTRERLQTTIEELETSNEEMKSSNEEFQSVNEELQSSNEELETSKEELQSVNEELETVNAELNTKIDSLDRAISDRKNLLESTQIATVFLDTHLRIKSFTPAITDIFHLIESDFGRPITDIATKITYEHLPRDVRHVLRTLSRVEREVTVADGGASYIMRVLPYRTVDNVIDGVVVTFIDISERKRGEEAMAQLAAIVASSYDAIVGVAPDGTIRTWNAGAERIYGYGAPEAIGRPLSLIMPPDRGDELRRMLDRLRRAGVPQPVETERLTKDGRRLDVSFTISPVRNAAGQLVVGSLIERDISAQKAAAEQLKQLVAELKHRVKNTLATVLSVAARTRESSQTVEEFAHAFEGRVQALAKTHDLLTRQGWTGVSLRSIAEGELEPFATEAGQVRIAGPELVLAAHPATMLGMVLHELATNAAKHGALAGRAGSVRLSWKVGSGAEPVVTIRWQERGGPPAQEPERRGFGLAFIERCLSYELGGTAQIQFARTGLRCALEFPASQALATRAGGRAGTSAG